ncbi:MAG: SsrA-binding protein SmpB [Dehalococcoidia bacterium]|nr:SsrA-binding protein SmpB [Dehalococcoidia bacterium]
MTDKTITVNRKAYFDYHVEEAIEAGLVLMGSEIKSIRAGRVNLRDAYARVENREVWLLNMHISPYGPASHWGHEPTRSRKLLLHRSQIEWLRGKVKEKGLTLIPLKLFIKNDVAKIDLGLARGKKTYDKREAMATQEAKREIDRALRERQKS